MIVKRVPQPPKESKSIKQWMIKKGSGFSNIYPGFVNANTKSEARAKFCSIFRLQKLPANTVILEVKTSADPANGESKTVTTFMEP